MSIKMEAVLLIRCNSCGNEMPIIKESGIGENEFVIVVEKCKC